MAKNSKSDIVKRLQLGEKIKCLNCKKGIYTAPCEDVSKCHGFRCNVCGNAINIEASIFVE